MQKPTSIVSFLLMLTAFVLLVIGIITAVAIYQMWANVLQAFPTARFEHFEAIWISGAGFFIYFVPALVLLALAQISDSTAASASEAEAQTEYLRQIAANADARASTGGPSVDDTARKVAAEIRVQGRPQ
jgi:hypothetical protein